MTTELDKEEVSDSTDGAPTTLGDTQSGSPQSNPRLKKMSIRTRIRRDSVARFDLKAFAHAQENHQNRDRILAALIPNAEERVQRISIALCHLLSPLTSIIKTLNGDLANAFSALYKMKTHCIDDQLNPLNADTTLEAKERCEFLLRVAQATGSQYDFAPPLTTKYDFDDEHDRNKFLNTQIIIKSTRENSLFAGESRTILDFVNQADHLILQHLLDFRIPGHCELHAHHKSAFEYFVEELTGLASKENIIISCDFTFRSKFMMTATVVTKEVIQVLLDLKSTIDTDWKYTLSIKPSILSKDKFDEVHKDLNSAIASKKEFDHWFEHDLRYQTLREVYHWSGVTQQRKMRTFDEVLTLLPDFKEMTIDRWRNEIKELKGQFARGCPAISKMLTSAENGVINLATFLDLTCSTLSDNVNGYIDCQEFLYEESVPESTLDRRKLSRSSQESSSPGSGTKSPEQTLARGKSFALMTAAMSKVSHDGPPARVDGENIHNGTARPISPQVDFSALRALGTPAQSRQTSPSVHRKKSKKTNPKSLALAIHKAKESGSIPQRGSSKPPSTPSSQNSVASSSQGSPQLPARKKGSKKGSHVRSRSMGRDSSYTIAKESVTPAQTTQPKRRLKKITEPSYSPREGQERTTPRSREGTPRDDNDASKSDGKQSGFNL